MFGLGVADGIYMWKEIGIDSGVFSRTLMETAQHMVEAGYSDVLRIAQICSRKVQTEGVYGSSTFCLVVLDRAFARMHTACLGDSGFMVMGTTPEQPEVQTLSHPNPVMLSGDARTTLCCRLLQARVSFFTCFFSFFFFFLHLQLSLQFFGMSK
jgi:hypothetical protein